MSLVFPSGRELSANYCNWHFYMAFFFFRSSVLFLPSRLAHPPIDLHFGIAILHSTSDQPVNKKKGGAWERAELQWNNRVWDCIICTWCRRHSRKLACARDSCCGSAGELGAADWDRLTEMKVLMRGGGEKKSQVELMKLGKSCACNASSFVALLTTRLYPIFMAAGIWKSPTARSSGLFFAHLCNITLVFFFCFFFLPSFAQYPLTLPSAPFDVSAGSLPLRKNSPGFYRPIIIIGAAVRHCANVFHWDLGPPLLHSLSALWSSSSCGHFFFFK